MPETTLDDFFSEAAPDAPRASRRPDGVVPVGPARVRVERVALWVSASLAIAVPALTVLDVHFPGRAVLAFAFVLAVPGIPLASLVRLPNSLLAASLAGALSIACSLLTATAALQVGWDPVGWSLVLAAVHLAATAWALRRLDAQPGGAAPAPSAARGGSVGRGRQRAATLAALALAVALWWLSTRWVHLGDAGALGVIGVVGWAYVLAVAIVAGVAAVHLRRAELDELMLAATAVVLTLIVFAYVNVADGEASVPTGWLHVGFVRYISDHHASFYGLDARASWPGFFAAAASLVRLAGVPDASAFLQLSPFFYNAAAIAPLLVIARCVTRSHRLAWLSIFVYLGANWFQQDYFSPQATVFLLYLVILATLLWSATHATVPAPTGGRLARIARVVRRRPGLPAGMTVPRSLALEGAFVLLGAAIVVTHQLTPVTLVLTLLVFVFTGYTRYRRLWLLISLLFLGWFSYGATDFWSGHLDTVFGDVGQLGSNLNTAVASRVVGDPTYQLMQQVRLGWSVVYVLLALLGLWGIRRRPDAPLIALLAASAGSLVALQSYGGEVVLRVFVYAAPLLAPLAARALQVFTGRRIGTGLALAGVVAAYGMLGTTTRGVNISFERVTKDDVAAAQVLWSHLRKDDTVALFYASGAYAANRFGEWTTLSLSDGRCDTSALACVLNTSPRFVLTGREQDAAQHLISGAPPGSTTSFADTLVQRGLYTVLYRSPDTELLVLNPQGG